MCWSTRGQSWQRAKKKTRVRLSSREAETHLDTHGINFNHNIIAFAKTLVLTVLRCALLLWSAEKQLDLRCRSHTFVVADVANAKEVSKGLLRAGLKPEESSIFIAEGLLYYLQADVSASNTKR